MAAKKITISLRYCPQCNWLLRTSWMAQELLNTFVEDIEQVSLIPDDQRAGTFEIRVDGELIWERKRDGGFPDIKELKQKVRDIADPKRDLGHIDKPSKSE